MYVEQLYTGCLSEAAYYIESENEAVIIDPIRDIDVYLQLAKKRGTIIKYIFETHFHADFVSGHLDLSKATGAPIIYGPQTKANFNFYLAKDGEEFKLGKLTFKTLHTPGHTLESTCYLLKDEAGKDYAVFTGDTLFVGDVGRPDLAQGSTLTTTDLAGMLYESLQNKIAPLADEVIVYPAHGAGSSCGKNLGPETNSTIGEEKKNNYALRAENKEVFIKAVANGLNEPPQYFSLNAKINKEGYESIDAVMKIALTPLSVQEIESFTKDDDYILLDTRPAEQFTVGFIPSSINIGLEGRFAEWAGNLLKFDKQIILVTEAGKEKESAVRLARVGFEKIAGYLNGSFDAWKKAKEPVDMIIDVDADEVAMDIPFDSNLVIVDVRKEVEYANGHVKDAVNIPLETLTDPGSMADFKDTDNIYLHCAGGYRSVIAASLFKRQGIHNIRNINGGWDALKEQEKIETEKSSDVLN